jgi:hypothetical protein
LNVSGSICADIGLRSAGIPQPDKPISRPQASTAIRARAPRRALAFLTKGFIRVVLVERWQVVLGRREPGTTSIKKAIVAGSLIRWE